jgi:protein-S-isoprenylcysteine O-methyltransferase Ste14
MHINFFGDATMFIGYAMVTHYLLSAVPVLSIILYLLLSQIPQLDAYLLQKYGESFRQYAQKTNKFIPWW